MWLRGGFLLIPLGHGQACERSCHREFLVLPKGTPNLRVRKEGLLERRPHLTTDALAPAAPVMLPQWGMRVLTEASHPAFIPCAPPHLYS